MTGAISGDTSLVSVTTDESRIVATDAGGNHFELDAKGWVDADDADALDVQNRVDCTVTGQVSELRVNAADHSFAVLDGIDPEDALGDVVDDAVQALSGRYHLTQNVAPDLPDGSYHFRFSDALVSFLRVDGPVSVASRSEGGVTLDFPHPTVVTLGFRSSVDLPRHTVTVPETPEGVAMAASCLSAGLRTVDADRSFPSMRGHPPAVELGGEANVPAAVRERIPDTGVEIRVPPTVRAAAVVAPLAYYLGATVRTADAPPALRVPDRDFERRLPEPPDLQYAVARVLRRVFSLDVLVRNAGPWGSEIRELEVLDRVDLDLEACYEQTLGERVVTYFGVDFAAIEDSFPPWPHWLHVDPTDTETVVPALSAVVSDLGLVFGPDARGTDALVDATGGVPSSLDYRLVGHLDRDPSTREYAASVAGYRNRVEHVERSGDRTHVAVVGAVGDDEAVERTAWLTAHYRQRLGDGGRVDRLLADDPEALAAAFAHPTDLLHVVGDLRGDGIACGDGTLAPTDIPENRARLFVLDHPAEVSDATARGVACGLVEEGAVSGLTVARRPTPEGDPPTTLGTAIAAQRIPSTPAFAASALVVDGASTEMARRLLSYLGDADGVAVAGDGTYRLGAKGRLVRLWELDSGEEDTFRGSLRSLFVVPGGLFWTYGEDERPRLNGGEHAIEFGVEFLREEVFGTELLLHNGSLYWPNEASRLLYPLA